MSTDGGQVELVDPAAAGKDIQAVWRDLAMARENPFLTPEWFEAWHDPEREEPFVLAWRRAPGAEVAAVLPLLCRRGVAGRSLRFPGSDNGDWFGLACAEADVAAAASACLRSLRSRSREWDVLRLDRVPGHVFHVVDGNRDSDLGLVAVRPPDVLPFVALGEGGYDGWLASRSRNFRSQLGRRRRRLEREHELVLADTPGPEGLGAALETLFALHGARREMQGGEGALGVEARTAYARFAARSLERGWLRMHSLALDGETVAAWYGWRLGGRYMYGISGFEPACEELAVGTVLLAHTIERAAAEGAAVYDLLWGDEAYKARYETGRRSVETFAAATGPRGRTALATEAAARAVAGRLPGRALARLRWARGGGGSG